MSKNKKVADYQLHPVSAETFDHVEDIIDSTYTKVELVEICKSLHRYCESDKPLTVAPRRGQKDFLRIQTEYHNAKNAKKSVYTNYAALFLSSSHNFALFLSSLPDEHRNLWSEIMYKKFVMFTRYSDDEFNEFLNWFSECDQVAYKIGGKITFYISLDSFLYDLVEPYLEDFFTLPQIASKTDKDLSADNRFSIYSNVEGLESEFFILDEFNKQSFSYLLGKPIPNPTIQSLVTRMQFPLPLAEAKPTNVLNRTAASLFIYTYIELRNYLMRPKDNTSIFKTIRDSYLKMLFGSSNMLHNRYLPHLTKQTSRLSEAAYSTTLMRNFFNLSVEVMDSNMEVWYDIESLVTRLKIKTRPSAAFLYEPYAYEYDYIKRRSDKSPIEFKDAIEQVVTPLIRAFLLMCATMGLCDVALDLSRTDEEKSYVEPVRYVRFNDMARYVFGLDNKMPTLAKAQSNIADDFKLSDDHLVIHVKHNSRFAGMLTEYAERLTPTLWRVTHATFMRNCASMTDMTQKIETFKKNFCPNPPQNWLDFFSDFASRIKVMEQSKKTYAVFNVPKNRTDIQRLILSDPILSQLAVRAEGYLVLVESLNLQKFRKRFEALGYTLG